jgi:hypothetical protein
MPDFPGARIPAATFNPSVHAAMTDLVQQRDRCDYDLHLMVHDEAADGTPLDPQRNYELAMTIPTCRGSSDPHANHTQHGCD